MKLSLSCRIAEGFLSKEDAILSLPQLCDLAVQAGYEAICMRASQIRADSAPDEIAAARETIRQRNLGVTMVTGDFDIVYNNDRGPNCLSDIAPHLDLAEALGAPMIRVCIKQPSDITSARRAADQAAERGISLVHQCHSESLFETVDEIELRFRQIDRPNFGLIFEAANLLQSQQHYGPATITRLAPWIRNVYIQNQRFSEEGAITLNTWSHGPVSFDVIGIPQPGGIDFSIVFEGLKQIGYDGTVTVHQAASQDKASMVSDATQTAKFLRSLM